MIHTIYLENKAKKYKITKDIIDKNKSARIIYIDNYKQILNKQRQNFQEQKKLQWIFIIWKKEFPFIYKIPNFCVSKYEESYYFSLSLNCIYNCEYCFLQWVYSSAFPVFFVNVNDFIDEIKNISLKNNKEKIFYLWYESDNLAIDENAIQLKKILDKISKIKNSHFELRTKSWNIKTLNILKPIKNLIISWSINPEQIIKSYEHWANSLKQRIKAIKYAQNLWFRTALRIEPVIYGLNYKKYYDDFFLYLKDNIDFDKIEDIHFGLLKIPKIYLDKIQKMHIKSDLIQRALFESSEWQMTYDKKKALEIENYIYEMCTKICDKNKVFYTKTYQ